MESTTYKTISEYEKEHPVDVRDWFTVKDIDRFIDEHFAGKFSDSDIESFRSRSIEKLQAKLAYLNSGDLGYLREIALESYGNYKDLCEKFPEILGTPDDDKLHELIGVVLGVADTLGSPIPNPKFNHGLGWVEMSFMRGNRCFSISASTCTDSARLMACTAGSTEYKMMTFHLKRHPGKRTLWYYTHELRDILKEG